MQRNLLIVPLAAAFALSFLAPVSAGVQHFEPSYELATDKDTNVLGTSNKTASDGDYAVSGSPQPRGEPETATASDQYSLSSSPLPQLTIVQKRIPLTEKRKDLTREYTKMHYGFEAVYMDAPKVVVVHWTAGGSINSVYNYFAKDEISVNDEFHKNNGKVNVGSQFLVDRDGTIYQLFDETFIARQCIGMNYHSIGIENIGGVDGKEDLTDAQLQANILLIDYLETKYPTIDLVIGHLESYKYVNYPEYYTELIDGYITQKVDPGKTFIRNVRLGVAKLEQERN